MNGNRDSTSFITKFSITENEFLAEESIVTIIPNIDHPILRFVSGNFGPLTSGMPCELPLWLAILIRKRAKCIIKTPEWMQVKKLEEFIQSEKNSRSLSPLPFFYMEIGHLLLQHAKEDILEAEKVSILLHDLEAIRMDRLRMGIAMTAETVNKDDSVVSTALNNVSSMEITAIRDFFLNSMDTFLWLKPPEGEEPMTEAAGYGTTTIQRGNQVAQNINGAARNAAEISNGQGEDRERRKLRKFRNT